MPHRKSSYAAVLALIALAVTAGCTLGIKSWPEPVERQDNFSWRSVTPRYEGQCLMVEARLDGEYRNLDTIYLRLQPLDDEACAGCPFKPVRNYEFRRGTPGFELVGPWMQMSLCDIDPSIAHRLQLSATSRLSGPRAISSDVARIDP